MTGHRFHAGDMNRLNDEHRRQVQPAEGIVDRMDPTPTEVAADLGCGNGYVSVPLARRVAKVLGLDAQQEMLDALMANVPADLRGKVVPVLGELPQLPLDDRSVDRAVMVNVAHEVADMPALVSELRRCLRGGGRLSIVDFPKNETSFGPPLHERVSEEEMVAAFPGFRKIRGWSFPEFYQLELMVDR
jgi:ubiquinone/menaquinone biosynthesis C-methylase UbiE